MTRMLLLSEFIMTLSLSVLNPIFAVFVEKIGGGILDITYAWTIFGLISGILMIIFGRMERSKKGYIKMLILGYLLQTLGLLIYAFVDNLVELLIAEAILGVSIALQYPSFDALFSSLLPDDEKGKGWGMYDGIESILESFACAFSGVLANFFGFKALFILSSVISLIASCALIFYIKKLKI